MPAIVTEAKANWDVTLDRFPKLKGALERNNYNTPDFNRSRASVLLFFWSFGIFEKRIEQNPNYAVFKNNGMFSVKDSIAKISLLNASEFHKLGGELKPAYQEFKQYLQAEVPDDSPTHWDKDRTGEGLYKWPPNPCDITKLVCTVYYFRNSLFHGGKGGDGFNGFHANNIDWGLKILNQIAEDVPGLWNNELRRINQ